MKAPPPITITKTVVEKVKPPTELLEPCPTPDLDQVGTTGDLEAVAIDALVALAFCNKDKEQLREWSR